MSAESLPFAIAMMVLVGFFAIGMVLIPLLDSLLARETARRDAAREEARHVEL